MRTKRKRAARKQQARKPPAPPQNVEACSNFVAQNSKPATVHEAPNEVEVDPYNSTSSSSSSSTSTDSDESFKVGESSSDDLSIDRRSRKSAKSCGRSSQMSKIREIEESHCNIKELKAASLVIEKVVRMEEAKPFSVPVDPIALGRPDYFDIVRTPVDFGTIVRNLQNSIKYKNSRDVFNDVEYIWENCLKLYKKGEYIVYLMKRVKKKFMKYWTAAGLDSGYSRKSRVIIRRDGSSQPSRGQSGGRDSPPTTNLTVDRVTQLVPPFQACARTPQPPQPTPPSPQNAPPPLQNVSPPPQPALAQAGAVQGANIVTEPLIVDLNRPIIQPLDIDGIDAVRKRVKDCIRMVLTEPWPSWGRIPRGIKKLMLERFGEYFRWHDDHHNLIADVFYHRASRKYKSMMSNARKRAIKACPEFHTDRDFNRLRPYVPNWASNNIWVQLCEHWNSEGWKVKSNVGKENRATQQEDGGITKHTAGPKPLEYHRQQMYKELQRDPYPIELFRRTHTKKGTGEFVDAKSRRVHDAYENEVRETHGLNLENQPSFDDVAWERVMGVQKKNGLHGVPKSSVDPGLFTVPTSQTRLEEMEEQMQAIERKMREFKERQEQELQHSINATISVVWVTLIQAGIIRSDQIPPDLVPGSSKTGQSSGSNVGTNDGDGCDDDQTSE